MKKFLMMPVLAAALFAAACGGDGDPTGVSATARVRFFNATTGMTGSGGFTANGQFASGSALAYGQSACSQVNGGSTLFGFGSASGTGLSGNALATLNNQNIAVGGNYTVVAMGAAASPTLLLLDNNFSGTLAANQAAVRFVNLAPGTVNLFTVFSGVLGAGGTLLSSNIEVGAPTAFSTVSSGSSQFTILNGHDTAISGAAASLNLQAGSVNTVAIVPTTSGGFQLINLTRCS
jgi:hypothetical protein